MTYQPKPIDTSKVELSSSVLGLTEKLAEHAHEVWAVQRIKDGWSHGAARDDAQKLHPCLIPYDQLSDSEKQYDRNAALETLKVIQALGYRILSPETGGGGESSERVREVLFAAKPRVADLLRLWQKRDVELAVWKDAATYVRMAEQLVALGVPYSAREVAEAGVALACGQERLRLRQLEGLAWARCGAVDAAAKVLCSDDLMDLPRDEEQRGLEAALQKQLALQTRHPEERVALLKQARDRYYDAWKAPNGSFWTGINVASVSLLMGDRDEAAKVAGQVEIACLQLDEQLRKTPDEKDDPYWRWATLGEALLNQGKLAQAEEWYRRAGSREAARGRVGHLNSTRRQLRYLLDALHEPTSLVDVWLPIPGIALFTGHRMDEPGRAVPRFPQSLEPRVKEAIAKWLIEHNIRTGVCSAANGADIIFLEQLQALDGSDTRIVLPFEEKKFIDESVLNGADDQWVARFNAVLQKASQVTFASPDRVGAGGQPFDYANRICLGQALMLQRELQAPLVGLAVWDLKPSTKPGGAAHCVERWKQQDLTVYSIDLGKAPHPQPLSPEYQGEGRVDTEVAPVTSSPLPIQCEGPLCEVRARVPDDSPIVFNGQSTPLMSMLFADVVGFSTLSDAGVELFIEHFLSRVAKCVEKYAPEVVIQPEQWNQTSIPVRETWGDGLYFALADVRTAGLFALDLCDVVRNTRWKEELGFEVDLQIRIALHCGPVHLSRDPITGLPKCTGTHVSRAARLEPKTPPNHVYASDAFAALCEEERITDFSCEFVKLLDWAKHYGTYPTYVVQRR